MSKKWNSDIMFPTDSNYIARIVGASFGPASTGTPMITLDWEVVSPQEKEVAGESITVAGVKVKTRYVTDAKDSEDTEAKGNIRSRVKDTLEKLGYEGEIDWDNLNVDALKGKLVYVQMSANIVQQRKEPTLEQIAAAKKSGKRAEGTIMKHPVTGKELIQYWPQIDEIFELAPSDGVKMPY